MFGSENITVFDSHFILCAHNELRWPNVSFPFKVGLLNTLIELDLKKHNLGCLFSVHTRHHFEVKKVLMMDLFITHV